MKTIKNIDVRDKKVILRAGFDVPMKEVDGRMEVSDDSRIRAVLPTLKYLIDNGAKVIIISHQGRPEGKVVEKYSLDPVALRLQEVLGKIVSKCSMAIGKDVEEAVNDLKSGEVIMLGNLRFYPGEEANDPEFSKSLASLGDIFVNDAFAVSHRAHASIEGITHFLPSYAGFLIEKEVETLGGIMKDPAKPFACIMGGAKVSDKVGIIKSLEDKIDCLLVGGAMANTFLASEMGEKFGESTIEVDKVQEAGKIARELREKGKEVVLPQDVVVSSRTDGSGEAVNVSVAENFEANWKILDIGKGTIELFKNKLAQAKTIFWNGNVGMSEVKPFDTGSVELAKILAEATESGVKTLICGGDTTGLVDQAGLTDKMTFLSTGGGAALEFLAGLELPGIKALE